MCDKSYTHPSSLRKHMKVNVAPVWVWERSRPLCSASVQLLFVCANFTFLTGFLWSHSRSTNPPRQRQTHHQRPALATNRPPPRAWCLPPRRPRATQPCPQPQQCTTAPATVACPPISVSGMCRTRLRAKHRTLHSNCTGPSGRRHFWDTRARERESEGPHRHLSIFYLACDRPKGDDDYQQRGGTCIIAEVCFILYRVTKKKRKRKAHFPKWLW